MSHMQNVPSGLPQLARRIAGDQSGVTAIVTAIALVVLLGFAGLAVDVAYWLNASRNIQSAADAGAYSAAQAGGQGSGCAQGSAPFTQATAVVAARGYIDGKNGTEVEVSCTPSTFTVKVSQEQPMWFSRLFLKKPPTAAGAATAQLAGRNSDLCVLAIDGTNPSEGYIGSDTDALYVTGSSGINIQCGIAVDSNNASSLGAGSNAASMTATDIYMVGDDQPNSNGYTPSITATGCSTCSPVIPPNQILRNQLPVTDPYANRVIPSHSCGTTSQANAPVNGVLDPSQGNGSPKGSGVGTFCNGLTLSGSVTVNCGTYIIAGGNLKIDSNAKVTQSGSCSTGVTFLLTNSNAGANNYATITYNGNPSSQLVLTAPTSGAYGGLVFFQDRNAPNPQAGKNNNNTCGSGSAQNSIAGGGNQVLTGAVYFPAQGVCFGGGSSSNNANKCTQLIAYNLNFTGNSALKSSCAGVGITPVSVLVPQLIK